MKATRWTRPKLDRLVGVVRSALAELCPGAEIEGVTVNVSGPIDHPFGWPVGHTVIHVNFPPRFHNRGRTIVSALEDVLWNRGYRKIHFSWGKIVR